MKVNLIAVRERSNEAKKAYRLGFMAGLEQAANISTREGYSNVADAIKSFADAAAILFNELVPESEERNQP